MLLLEFLSSPSDEQANSYSHRGTGGRGWVDVTLPRVFDMLQYFETILP